jgi:hypothetical protein
MNLEQNKTIVRGYLDEIVELGKYDCIRQLFLRGCRVQ